ncbi:MAG: ribokinase [Verrucomicrobiae bacterium]|nr:ribokinase [Verrucomicrobiae bacterium]
MKRIKKPSILVVGSSNTDMIIKLERIPRPGETLLGGSFHVAAGGKGANQAVAAARAGGRVTFIARVGRDIFGNQAVAGFVREGINVRYVARDRTSPSGVALIFVAKDGQNSIAVASGANAKLSPADVRKAGAAFAATSVLLMQLETPLETVQAAAELAAKNGVRIILNPAPARQLPDRLLRRVWILTPNETEAELLTGARGEEAASKLRSRGVSTVVLTLGERGALIADASGTRVVPAFKVKALDTTAAGDIFNGALAVSLSEGKPLDAAVRFANAAAAISVTRLGAQPSAPTRREIEQFLARRLHSVMWVCSESVPNGS